MFKFNFNNEDSEEGVSKTELAESNTIKWYESEEVSISSEMEDFVAKVPQSQINKIDYGNNLIFLCISPSEVIKIMKEETENNDFLDVVKADKEHSDLLPGKYEGGLKTWECTKDLALYFHMNVIEKMKLNLEGQNILDLGCGTGYLGIMCMQYGANVTYQDYNKEVLERMTIPNVLLNCPNFRNNVAFYSGDWASFIQLHINNNSSKKKYSYILTAETIYNVENYEKLISVFKNLLRPNGIIYVAAKSHYFGVGGTLFEFIHMLDKNNFDSKIVWETEEGNKNILEYLKKNFFEIRS